MAALEQAYRNSIMVGKYPGCVWNIECDSSFVDVNVHPAKIEVRFANEKPVFDLVYYATKSAIEAGDTPVEMRFNKNVQKPAQDFWVKPEPPVQTTFTHTEKEDFNDAWSVSASIGGKDYFSKKEIANESPTQKFSLNISEIMKAENDEASEQEAKTDEPTEQNIDNASKPSITDFKLIGEVFKTYILIEMESSLYIIDKHAAHERMNFEKLKSSLEINSQVLLSPVTVRLSTDEYNTVLQNIDLYTKCGFFIEDFGNSTVIVRECPSILDGEDVAGLIEETAEKLLDGKTDITPDKLDWILHSASCRAAVKAGDYTSRYEMEIFVKKLLSNPDIRYCPHGRPVMIKLSRYDIEKQFGRVQ